MCTTSAATFLCARARARTAYRDSRPNYRRDARRGGQREREHEREPVPKLGKTSWCEALTPGFRTSFARYFRSELNYSAKDRIHRDEKGHRGFSRASKNNFCLCN